MYICEECGKVFSSPKSYSEDRTPGGVSEGGSFVESYSACPYCEGTYTEAMQCARCEDKYISVDSSYPFCESCKEELLNSFASVIKENFREDEYDYIYDNLDHVEPYRKEK